MLAKNTRIKKYVYFFSGKHEMKHAPFIQNRKTGPSRKYPSPAFLGRKTKTAIKQKTENKEAKKKKKKNWYKKKQNKLQPYLQQ